LITHPDTQFPIVELSLFPKPGTGPDCEASSNRSHSCM